ncbi:MAG TPA: hypothetical protein VF715_14360 [Thermoleophilaceae bacterium]
MSPGDTLRADAMTGELSRRELLQRAAFLTAATYALSLAPAEKALALLDAASEVNPLVQETYLGLAAYVFPGNDAYSVKQGVTADGPGGVDTRAMPAFLDALDKYLPASALTHEGLPLGPAAAAVLNGFALQVDPGSAGGPFPAPFANLTLQNKNEVFRQLEAEATFSEAIPEINFLAGVIITFAAEMFYSEAGHFDRRTRRFEGEPVGWKLSGYGGPSDGHAELRGYYQGVRAFRRESDVGKLFPDGACCLKKPKKGVHGRPRGRCKKKAKGKR